MVEIDRGIPVPCGNANIVYPWLDMAIGDSFRLHAGVSQGWAHASNATRKYAPRKFIARKTDECFRVWRVA